MGWDVTRWLEIDAAHRLLKHGGKCRGLHGHRYKIGITISGRPDKVGVVLDFGTIKAKVGGWLDSAWDHGTILETGDPLIESLQEDRATKLVMIEKPPSAENLAKCIYSHWSHLGVTKVTVYETPNCLAEYSEPDVQNN